MGEWRYSSTLLDLGTRWRLVVSFMPLPLYFRRHSPQYPVDRGWVGPRAGLDETEKSLFPAWNRTSAAQPLARGCTARALSGDLIIVSDSSRINTNVALKKYKRRESLIRMSIMKIELDHRLAISNNMSLMHLFVFCDLTYTRKCI
jgi:hypothetical protein